MDHLLRATAIAESRHFWFRGFRYFVAPLLERAAGGRSDLRILDCGCGTGNNLELLARFGQAYGFDLTASGLAGLLALPRPAHAARKPPYVCPGDSYTGCIGSAEGSPCFGSFGVSGTCKRRRKSMTCYCD